jgi:hypothetical protein
MSDWQPIETAPRDQTIIEGQFADGAVRRMIWAWGGGWAGEWDRRRRYGFGGWLSFNDTHQPTAWRDCGGENVNTGMEEFHRTYRAKQESPE